jgi:hypothetical protein
MGAGGVLGSLRCHLTVKRMDVNMRLVACRIKKLMGKEQQEKQRDTGKRNLRLVQILIDH